MRTEFQKLDKKEITAIIRKFVNTEFKGFKFSVTRKNYNSISVIMTKSAVDVFATEEQVKSAPSFRSEKETLESLNYYKTVKRYDVNNYHIQDSIYISPEAKAIFQKIHDFSNTYNFDESDIQSDYFCVGFYLNLGIELKEVKQ